MRTARDILGRLRSATAVAIAVATTGLLLATAGCTTTANRFDDSGETILESLHVDAGMERAVLEATVTALRDAGYATDRTDYRQHVVTTQPEPVATALEPWAHRRQLQGAAWAGTLGKLRRVVRVTLEPAETLTNPPTLRLAVQLERFESPTTRVINASGARVLTRLDDVPSPWARRGVDARYWRPIGRDTAEEARLLRRVRQQLNQQ